MCVIAENSRSPDEAQRNPGCYTPLPQDYSLRSPYGPPCGRSTRFALLCAALHPGYIDVNCGKGVA